MGFVYCRVSFIRIRSIVEILLQGANPTEGYFIKNPESGLGKSVTWVPGPTLSIGVYQKDLTQFRAGDLVVSLTCLRSKTNMSAWWRTINHSSSKPSRTIASLRDWAGAAWGVVYMPDDVELGPFDGRGHELRPKQCSPGLVDPTSVSIGVHQVWAF